MSPSTGQAPVLWRRGEAWKGPGVIKVPQQGWATPCPPGAGRRRVLLRPVVPVPLEQLEAQLPQLSYMMGTAVPRTSSAEGDETTLKGHKCSPAPPRSLSQARLATGSWPEVHMRRLRDQSTRREGDTESAQHVLDVEQLEDARSEGKAESRWTAGLAATHTHAPHTGMLGYKRVGQETSVHSICFSVFGVFYM